MAGILAALTLYAVAMAYVEAMVVVYLRRMLPFTRMAEGTVHEVKAILQANHLYFEEQTREAATIIMLAAVALATGKGARERWAAFLWCFALWDICYYLFLRVWTGWPRSLAEWDVLFLIPVPWLAPVGLPVAIAAAMAVAALLLFRGGDKG